MKASFSRDRWEEAWTADLDVIRNLRSNGDDPSAPREIDVSFRGSRNALKRLAAACSNFGFKVQSLDNDEEGEPWLFLARVQTSDDEAMRELTETYLQIEDSFDVECDGWGCMANNHDGPISNENPA